MAKKEEVCDPDWFVVDADGQIVGRLAVQIATILMGKHKADYTPHVNSGDCVIVTNVERVRFSGGAMQHAEVPYMSTKMGKKSYDRYTGYPGGLRSRTAVEAWQHRPEMILREAVRRMLPKNKLADQMLKRLRLFVGPEHTHQAQQPKPFPAHMLPSTKLQADS
ncbi:MAG: 50S ribosomal protein L13 [Planctomycetaceae bacterium]|nr:50S ribosomal protein L13 [Planctomycetaceae bacterium]